MKRTNSEGSHPANGANGTNGSNGTNGTGNGPGTGAEKRISL